MTVTTTTLGSNSAEITVYDEIRYASVLSAIDTFITAHGWTEKAGVGNDLEKVYTSANAVGGGTKEIKINAIDLTIQHADSFTGTNTVVATNEAFRWMHNGHLKYPENLFTSDSGSASFIGEFTTGGLTPSSRVTDNSTTAALSTYNGDSYTFTITAGLGETLYPGQFIRLQSKNNAGEYIDAQVKSHNNVTGQVDIKRYHGAGTTSETEWYLLTHSMNYNDTVSPAYVYISASSKHCVIQCKNTNGMWHDFVSVCETENPLSLSDASILTTGYMLGNSGFVKSITSADTGHTSRSYYESDFPDLPEINDHEGHFKIWTGPFSQPSTRKNRTGVDATRFTKIATPLGVADGCLGAIPNTIVARYHSEYDNYISTGSRFRSLQVIKVFFKGMGDVIPDIYETNSSKHYAFSGSASSDYSDTTTMSILDSDNFMLDNWPGMFLGTNVRNGEPLIADSSTAQTIYLDQPYEYNTASEDFSWSTQEPSLLGRIYNIKFVTTGLSPMNVLSIKVDASGFAEDTGSSIDHIVFSYQQKYDHEDVPSDRILDRSAFQENEILRSQSAAVAFPK